MIEVINNFFNEEDLNLLNKEIQLSNWELSGFSIENSFNPKFWLKDIINTGAHKLFKSKIENGIKQEITIDRLYVNGQAHSQCGDWHTDVKVNSINCFTIVYFYKEWKPEYGGFLLIKETPIVAVIPEFNKAVLFDSTLEHMGMEPTIHCKTQRESIA
jgi:hypothetical protein